MKSKIAYLTIDDAPTENFLNKVNFLSKHRIPAIFFIIGKCVNKKGEKMLVNGIRKGFVIGNHSYNHPNFSEISVKEAEEEIKKTDDLIEKLYSLAGKKRKLKVFRFPHLNKGGRKKKQFQKLLRKYGYNLLDYEGINYKWFKKEGNKNEIDVNCTYDSMDWTVADKSYEYGICNLNELLKRMDEDVPEGHRGINFLNSYEIIMMHDDIRIADCFKPMIKKLLKKGIVFKLPKIKNKK